MALKITKTDVQTVENTPSGMLDFEAGAKLTVYGINHPLYQLALERIETQKLTENILNLNEKSYRFETQVEVVGNYLIKDWEGFVDDDDEPLELTPQNFKEACLSYPELLGKVINKAVEVQLEHNKTLGDMKKKPSRVGSGMKKAKA